jgi:hypothetical protein
VLFVLDAGGKPCPGAATRVKRRAEVGNRCCSVAGQPFRDGWSQIGTLLREFTESIAGPLATAYSHH